MDIRNEHDARCAPCPNVRAIPYGAGLRAKIMASRIKLESISMRGFAVHPRRRRKPPPSAKLEPAARDAIRRSRGPGQDWPRDHRGRAQQAPTGQNVAEYRAGITSLRTRMFNVRIIILGRQLCRLFHDVFGDRTLYSPRCLYKMFRRD
jgi:hypothetical protein